MILKDEPLISKVVLSQKTCTRASRGEAKCPQSLYARLTTQILESFA
jgi:hypothetical protein